MPHRHPSDDQAGTPMHEKRKGRPENPRALTGQPDAFSGPGATIQLGVHKRNRASDGLLYSQIAGI